MSEVEDFRAAQEREWNQYVAKERIYIDAALAFLPGDPVPAGHVDRKVVSSDQVVKTSTKAGQALVAGDTEKG